MGDLGWIVLDEFSKCRGEVFFHEGTNEYAFVDGDTVLTESDLRDLYLFLKSMTTPRCRCEWNIEDEHWETIRSDCPMHWKHG